MAEDFELEVATPDRLLVRDHALRAQIPCEDGYIGVLPEHAPLLSELGIGVLTYVTPQDVHYSMAIKQGFVEVLDNHVRVLADTAERGNEIDITQAKRDLERAQQAMTNPVIDMDIAAALIAWKHAQARIDAARKQANKEE